jgi:3-hydroxyacyl-[acyl-carrier-protein] dehydratase
MRFLLIDRITQLDRGIRARALKNITLSEDYFTHHFPDQPIMPGALITECLVQLADWVLREREDFNVVALPSSFESVKFHQLVRPGDQLELEVELVGEEGECQRFNGHARRGGQVVAAARFTMVAAPAAELLAPDVSRRLFEMIRAGNA